MFDYIGEKLSDRESLAVSVADLRKQLSMSDDEGDSDLLQSLIDAAQCAIELRTRRVLSPRRIAVAYRGCGDSVRLSFSPIVSLVSVVSDGTEISGCSFSEFGVSPVVTLPERITASELVITADFGYETGFSAPADLVLLVKVLAADLFEHREAQSDAALSENASYMRILNRHTVIEVG